MAYTPSALSTGLTLAEVLELEVVQRTQPQIVHGADALDRIVRWVHTSELAEVPALLKGGELLLTTGLGLAGGGPAAHGRYIHDLAANGLTALALELGWTFKDVPESLATAARECDLPLFALQEIVPFVEITEEIQSRLVHKQVARLQLDREVHRVLHEVLLRAEGLAGLATAVAHLAQCPVVVETTTGNPIAVAGVQNDESPRELLRARRKESTPIDVLGQPWGLLHLVNPPTRTQQVAVAVLEHAPTAIALSLLSSRQTTPLNDRLRSEFISDLIQGRFRSERDLLIRLSLLGVPARSGEAVVGAAIGDYAPEEARTILHAIEAAVADREWSVVAEGDDIVYAAMSAVDAHDAQALADHLYERLTAQEAHRATTRRRRLALGSVVTGLESLGSSLREARDTLRLAQEIDSPPAVTAQGMTADRLIAKLLNDPEVSAIVEQEVGALFRYDREHSTDLAKTLWIYLAEGCSKTTAARKLHLRRQSLYQRLTKVQQLIGADLANPQKRISLILALKTNELLQRRTHATSTAHPHPRRHRTRD